MSKLSAVVYSDTVCAWCFILKRNLDAAIQTVPCEIKVEWRPYFLDLAGRSTGKGFQEHLVVKFGEERCSAVAKEIQDLGVAAGIIFDDDRLMCSSMSSHKLLLAAQAQGRQDAAVEAIMRAYFEKAADISDLDVLEAIADSVGVAEVREYLESPKDEDVVIRMYEDAITKHNIQGAPFVMLSRADAPSQILTLSGAQSTDVLLEAFEALM